MVTDCCCIAMLQPVAPSMQAPLPAQFQSLYMGGHIGESADAVAMIRLVTRHRLEDST